MALRNYSVDGGFYLTTSQFGSNFYIGNNPNADGTYASIRFGRGAPEFEAILAAADALHAKARGAMDRQGIKAYLDAVWAVVADANRYFAGEEPWAKRKTDFKRMETILYVTAEVVRQVAILAQPVTPAGAGKLLDGLCQAPEARNFTALGETGRLQAGTLIPAPAGAFPRYVDPEEAAAAPEGNAKPRKQKPQK